MRAVALVLTLASCRISDVNFHGPGDGAVPDGATDSRAIDAAVDARAPQQIALLGSAHALLWAGSDATLYVTDADTRTVDAWTDAAGLAAGIGLPQVGAVTFGQIAGTGSALVVPFSTSASDNQVAVLPAGSGVWAERDTVQTLARVGVATDAQDHLFEAVTFANGSGGLGTFKLDGGATEMTAVVSSAAFGGIAVTGSGDVAYASIPSADAIYSYSTSSGSGALLASVPTPGQLLVLTGGDLLVGGGSVISRVTPAGTVTTVALGWPFAHVSGLAYDEPNGRLFVVDQAHPSTLLVFAITL